MRPTDDTYLERTRAIDINDPEHRSGLSEAVSAACVVVLGGVVLFSIFDVNWMPLFFKIFFVNLVAAGVGFWTKWRVGGAQDRRKAQVADDVRASIEQETQKQLAEMKRNNNA